MTIASRFLSVNSEDVLLEDKKREDRKSPDSATDPEQSSNTNHSGRPGQLCAKVRKASNLPLISGPAHRFVELDYSGTYNILVLTQHINLKFMIYSRDLI